MFYAFSTLLFVLSLVTGIPAILQFLRMRKIKQNSATATGMVKSDSSSLGWLMSSELGGVSRPRIIYQTAEKKDLSIEVVDSNAFKIRRYELGETVKVIYNKSDPWQAYVEKEYYMILRDLKMAGGELLVAVLLWSIGLALKLPI
jgi:hypothetical protein